jgi:hypothetical protein
MVKNIYKNHAIISTRPGWTEKRDRVDRPRRRPTEVWRPVSL